VSRRSRCVLSRSPPSTEYGPDVSGRHQFHPAGLAFG
jgi:hypothetical protein